MNWVKILLEGLLRSLTIIGTRHMLRGQARIIQVSLFLSLFIPRVEQYALKLPNHCQHGTAQEQESGSWPPVCGTPSIPFNHNTNYSL